MNNFLFKKIAVAFVGIAMAIGVGVGVSQTNSVKSARAESIASNFTDKELSVGNGELTWTSSKSANSFESSNSKRGVQFGAAIGEFTLSSGPELSNSATISNVSMTVSTNGTASVNTIEVKVGTTDFKNNNSTTYQMPKENNYSVAFSGSSSGQIVITLNDTNKSIYIKNISVTYSNDSGGGDTPVTPTYTVTYDGNGNDGGTVPEDDTQYESGTEVTISNDVPTKERYTFAGWNDGTTTRQAGSKFNISANTTLTAVWTLNATHAGTEQDPYDVLDAKAAIDTNTGVSNVYVAGTVSAIVEQYNSQYGNITFDISDDGETTSPQFRAYRTVGTTNFPINSAESVLVGDLVVCSGNLTKYNSVYELAQGNELVSLTRPDIINRKAESFKLYLGEDLDLTTCVTASGSGELRFSIPQETTVATLNGTTLTADDSEEGSVVVTAYKGEESTTFTVVVMEEPLQYVINFGSTRNTNPSQITSESTFKTIYSFERKNEVTISNISSLYGTNNTQMLKMGTSKNSGSITFTIPSTSYVTGVSLAIYSCDELNINVTSGATGATTETQAAVAGTLDFDDNLLSEMSSSVTIATNVAGAVYLTNITITYLERTPELHASSTNVEAVVNTSSTSINLTYDNYTPTSYNEEITGTSVTSVSYNTSVTPHTATFTTSASVTGVSTVRITGTGGGKTAYVDITITVTNPRNLLSLSITTASNATRFVVGETFDVGSLVITGTFDAEPTSVTYSKANGNLGAFEALPEIGHVFEESEIGIVASAEFELTVGNGTDSVSYPITVVDKDYAHKITSISDLWDGQKVYFGNNDNKAWPVYSAGNTLSSVETVYHSTKGLDMASSSAYAYTVGRVKVNSAIYYTFSLMENETVYYLKDIGTDGTNAISKTTDTTDDTIYWTITAGEESGQWAITNKSNTAKPTLQINGTYLSCYKGQTDPYLYAVTPYSEAAVASAFESKCLLMDSYDPTQSTKGQPVVNPYGQCTTYYWEAKKVWEAMSDDEKIAISSEGEERLIAWATANGEKLDSDMHLVPASRAILFATAKQSTTSIIIVVISMASITAFGAFLFLRKRKEQ